MLTHYMAKKTVPNQSHNFYQEKYFSGSLKEFATHIKKNIANNPHLHLIENSSSHYIITESASLFSYGYFYYVQCKEDGQQLIVTVKAQAKLVAHSKDKKTLQKKLFSNIEFNDVG